MISTSIIIVNYNTKQLLIDCIDSVTKNTKSLEYEIIVVDNASTDGSKEFFEKDNRISYIYSNENNGFGKANNIGAKVAKGDYLFFLNSDTILMNNAITLLHEFIHNNKKVGIVGGNLYLNEKTPTHSYFRYFPSLLTELNNLSLGLLVKIKFGKNLYFNFTKNPIDVAFITGADLMIRKDVFDSLSGFDEDFFMYFEETDLSFRVKELGYRIVSLPTAKIIHLEGGSEKLKINTLTRYIISKKIYYHKRNKYLLFKLSMVLALIKCVIKLIKSKILNNKNEIEYWLKVKDLFIKSLVNK